MRTDGLAECYASVVSSIQGMRTVKILLSGINGTINIPKMTNYENFHSELAKRNALIEAQKKLLAMLEMAVEVKKNLNHLPPIYFAHLCTALDDCWKKEQLNLEAIEQINK